MTELLYSPFFGLFITIVAYWIGSKVYGRTGHILLNAMNISLLILIPLIVLFDIPYEAYNEGGQLITMMLAPATAALAVSIYNQVELLKERWLPVLVGCTVGALTSLGSVYALCRLFGFTDELTYSLLPKSVTTPIAVAVADSLGGIPSIAVAAVVVSGVGGHLAAPSLVKLFRVKDPVVSGLSIGACSHAMGTAKAVEMGETEGAMSGLAIGLCGLITVIAVMFIA